MKWNSFLRHIAIFAAAGILLPSLATAQDTAPVAAVPTAAEAPAADIDFSKLPEPMAFAKERYAHALKLNAMAPSATRDNEIKAFVDALVDYDDYAERSMGDKWAGLTAEKQTEFKALFRDLMEQTYLKRFSDKSFKDDNKVDWDRVVKTKTSATVSCFTQQKDVETELEIVLHADGNAWKVYDVLVDGASLAQTYQKKYGKKIDEKGVDGIMADMKTEIAKLHKK